MQVLDSILLVDDDEASNFFHKSLINSLGIAREVVETRDGREAFSFIQQEYYNQKQLPSLVLIDIAMPGMDGIQLIQELQHSRLLSVNKIPLAVVTSSASEKDQKAVRELGNYKYVTKALDELKFFEILSTAVAPTLASDVKKKFINEVHRGLATQMDYLKEQHMFLTQRREEINRYIQEVREKIKSMKK